MRGFKKNHVWFFLNDFISSFMACFHAASSQFIASSYVHMARCSHLITCNMIVHRCILWVFGLCFYLASYTLDAAPMQHRSALVLLRFCVILDCLLSRVVLDYCHHVPSHRDSSSFVTLALLLEECIVVVFVFFFIAAMACELNISTNLHLLLEPDAISFSFLIVSD